MTANKTKRPARTPNQREYMPFIVASSPPAFKQMQLHRPPCLHLRWDLSSSSSSSMATVARKMLLLELTFQRLETTAGCFPAEGDIKYAQKSDGKACAESTASNSVHRKPAAVYIRYGYQEEFGNRLPFLEAGEIEKDHYASAREPVNFTPFTKSVGSVHISLLHSFDIAKW